MIDHTGIGASNLERSVAFYSAALAPIGAPGLRSQYHPTYYAAFVVDPDGHNIEAVCHAPQ